MIPVIIYNEMKSYSNKRKGISRRVSITKSKSLEKEGNWGGLFVDSSEQGLDHKLNMP